MRKWTVVLAAVTLMIGSPQVSQGQFVQSDNVTFEALNQSMWGPGSAAGFDWDSGDLLTTSWNATGGFDAIIGGVDNVCIPWTDICTDVDTRTGGAFEGSTNGTIGLEVGAFATAGNINVTMPGQATVSTSGLVGHIDNAYTIETGFVVDPAASMTTQFPTLELYADFIFDVYAEGRVRGCFIGAGCATTGGEIFNIDETIELASVNRDGSGQVRVLGVDTGLLPVETSIGPVDISIGLPNLETSTSAASTNLTSSGANPTIVTAGVDVPAMVADFILPGSSCLLSCEAFGFGYTVLGSSLGPDFGIGQEFTFTSTPMTTLSFSKPVSRIVNGVTLDPVSSFDVALGTNVDILFPTVAALDVTPTYWLQNSINVDTDFQTRGTFSLEVLSFTTPFGDVDPLYEFTASTDPLSVGIDDRDFAMNFNSAAGSTFRVVGVPEPPTVLLLLMGLLVVGVAARRRESVEGSMI